MTVQFLLILFLETKDNLDGAGVHGGLPCVGTDDAGGVLEDVCSNCLSIDGVFGDTFLVTTHLSRLSDTGMGMRIFLDALG